MWQKDQKRSFIWVSLGKKGIKAHEGEVIIVTVVDAAAADEWACYQKIALVEQSSTSFCTTINHDMFLVVSFLLPILDAFLMGVDKVASCVNGVQ